MTIPKHILETFDITGLQDRMDKADWFYDYTEDAGVWNRGLHEVNGIKNDLLELCKLDNGKQTANLLWDAVVPEYSISKPDFLIIKNNNMNEKNLSYLEGNLLYAGFGDQLNEQLKVEVAKQQPEFTLKLETEVNKQPVKAELYFKKSEETDMYFFNKYDVRMKAGKENEDVAQTFYINKGHGITLKEAYNLLNGRAVHKELENKAGEKYNAWVKLDFSEKDTQGNFKREQYHENYGYNVVEALSKYPIKELLEEKPKADLVASLEKGNVQVVTFEKNGSAEKIFVEANPQFKSVNVYDIKMQRIEKQVLAEKYGVGINGKESQTAKQNSKQSSKQGNDDEDGAGGLPKQKAKRSRKQRIS